MKWLSKIKTLRQLETATLWMLPEAFAAVILAYLLLIFLPFQKLSGLFGTLQMESPLETTSKESQLQSIYKAIHLSAKNVPFEAACYVQAVAAKLMLKRRKIESTLYLGVRKNKKGNTKGHAWLRSGHFIVTGAKGHEQYQVIATYA